MRERRHLMAVMVLMEIGLHSRLTCYAGFLTYLIGSTGGFRCLSSSDFKLFKTAAPYSNLASPSSVPGSPSEATAPLLPSTPSSPKLLWYFSFCPSPAPCGEYI
ncbi:hypothetical protein TB1_037201 [Malus domestica]